MTFHDNYAHVEFRDSTQELRTLFVYVDGLPVAVIARGGRCPSLRHWTVGTIMRSLAVRRYPASPLPAHRAVRNACSFQSRGQSMEKGGRPLRVAAISIGLLLCLVPSLIAASPVGREVAIGYGDVSITLPDGWSIDKGKVYIEIVSYVVKRPNSDKEALRIVATGTAGLEHFNPGAGRPYCVNGISGVSKVDDGMRTIELEMPPPSDSRVYDSTVIFKFRDSDLDAEKIVASTHLKGYQSKCPD